MYGLKINDHQLFFPQANGTEFNYCPSMDILQVVQNILTVCFIPDKNCEFSTYTIEFQSFYFFLDVLFCTGIFLCSSVVKNPPANAGDTGDATLIPGSRRSPGEVKGYPLQYSGL